MVIAGIIRIDKIMTSLTFSVSPSSEHFRSRCPGELGTTGIPIGTLFAAGRIRKLESVLHGAFDPVADECPCHEDNNIDEDLHNNPERTKIPKH